MAPQNVVRDSARNRGITEYQLLDSAKNSKYFAKYCGTFCAAIGNAGVIFVRYQLPVCFVLTRSYLRLYLAVFCVCVCSVLLETPNRWRKRWCPLSTAAGL